MGPDLRDPDIEILFHLGHLGRPLLRRAGGRQRGADVRVGEEAAQILDLARQVGRHRRRLAGRAGISGDNGRRAIGRLRRRGGRHPLRRRGGHGRALGLHAAAPDEQQHQRSRPHPPARLPQHPGHRRSSPAPAPGTHLASRISITGSCAPRQHPLRRPARRRRARGADNADAAAGAPGLPPLRTGMSDGPGGDQPHPRPSGSRCAQPRPPQEARRGAAASRPARPISAGILPARIRVATLPNPRENRRAA